jgi:hypothetical protein
MQSCDRGRIHNQPFAGLTQSAREEAQLFQYMADFFGAESQPLSSGIQDSINLLRNLTHINVRLSRMRKVEHCLHCDGFEAGRAVRLTLVLNGRKQFNDVGLQLRRSDNACSKRIGDCPGLRRQFPSIEAGTVHVHQILLSIRQLVLQALHCRSADRRIKLQSRCGWLKVHSKPPCGVRSDGASSLSKSAFGPKKSLNPLPTTDHVAAARTARQNRIHLLGEARVRKGVHRKRRVRKPPSSDRIWSVSSVVRATATQFAESWPIQLIHFGAEMRMLTSAFVVCASAFVRSWP